MNWRGYIISNQAIMVGKPVIKGTRIPVDLALEKLGNGETIPQLLASYPRVTGEGIYACLQFASEIIKNKVLI